MSGLEIIAKGGAQIERALADREMRLKRQHRVATRASAKVFQRHVKAALPKRTGTLRKHVRIFAVGEEAFKVKVTGHVAHLALGDVAAHSTAPKGMEAANTGRRRAIGPVLAKRALSFPGAAHPFPRALIPAHHGDQTLIPRARAEGSAEAHMAAMEALRS